MKQLKKVELIAPAGNLEKLKMAIIYGADAVYLGGNEYGLRAYAGNFSLEEMKEGIEFAHSMGKKAYVTMNIIPHNEDFEGMEGYIREICRLQADAVIISDPGVYTLVKQTAPEMKMHLSTQANNTNWRSARFWYEHGIKRIILSRELSLKEIEEIRRMVPEDLELEVFIHGAMCISYSGRCLLSNYMANRDANRGLCSHPCRWRYFLMEEKRPEQYMPVYEDEKGTFIFNSKDLCMIEHIPDIISTGVNSLKIEGRMKSSYYVATTVKAYREAINTYYKDPEGYEFNPLWLDEISKASHREYTTGFYFKKPGSEDQIYNTAAYVREYDFVGIILEYDKKTGVARVEQRNRMCIGDEIEVMNPRGKYFKQKIRSMKNEEKEWIENAPHPRMIVYMPMERETEKYAMLRRKKK
jgi:putative protease